MQQDLWNKQYEFTTAEEKCTIIPWSNEKSVEE